MQALHKFPFKNNTNYPIITECRKLLHKCSLNSHLINFAWIPSHTNIPGNDKADKLANEAVECGDIHPYTNYCHDLTAALPKAYLKSAWDENWEFTSQSKGKHYKLIQPSILCKPWFVKMNLSKTVTTILTRMRLGHVCTPAHLAKIHVLDNDSCICGSGVGDLNHIFFYCCLYDRSSFISSLLAIKIPFPTSITCLLYTNNIDVYNILAEFITHNNIKL